MSKRIIAVICSLVLCLTSAFAWSHSSVKAEDEKEVFCAFEYDGTNKVAKYDLDEYSLQAKMEAEGQIIDEGQDYTYSYVPTTGNGLLEATVTGTNLKHISWSKDYYNDTEGNEMTVLSPIINASSSNPWSANCCVSVTFDSSNYYNAQASLELACSKKGPCNFVITYITEKNGTPEEVNIEEVTLATNKQFTKVSFDVPSDLWNDENAQIFIKLANTTAFNGNELTDDANKESGEFAINNIIFSGDKINQETTSDVEPTSEVSTDDATTEATTEAITTDSTTEETTTDLTTETIANTTTEQTTTLAPVKLDDVTGLVAGETKDVYFVKWNKVNNAESYLLAIYSGDKLLYELPVVDTYMEISKTLIGGNVIPEGTYTIEVIAINDSINGSSAPSRIDFVFGDQKETTTAKKPVDVTIAKGAIKKVTPKKKSAKSLKVSFKAIPKYENAVSYKYFVKVFKSKKDAKKNKKALVSKYFKKANCTIKSKKIKNKKTLFVKVKYIVEFKDVAKSGDWSAVKKVKIKK